MWYQLNTISILILNYFAYKTMERMDFNSLKMAIISQETITAIHIIIYNNMG